MKLAVNATVEAETYPAGTDTSKVKDSEHRKVLEANKALFEDDSDDDGSGDAGGYDGREWTKAKLKAEVDRRNADLGDDQQVKAETDDKAGYVAALTLLDERHPVTA